MYIIIYICTSESQLFIHILYYLDFIYLLLSCFATWLSEMYIIIYICTSESQLYYFVGVTCLFYYHFLLFLLCISLMSRLRDGWSLRMQAGASLHYLLQASCTLLLCNICYNIITIVLHMYSVCLL